MKIKEKQMGLWCGSSCYYVNHLGRFILILAGKYAVTAVFQSGETYCTLTCMICIHLLNSKYKKLTTCLDGGCNKGWDLVRSCSGLRRFSALVSALAK